MAPLFRVLLLVASTLAWSTGRASFHTFVIDQVYSNVDGTVQFVVLREAQGSNGENVWSGHTLTSTHAGVAKSFTFPSNLPSTATAGKRVLVGTQGLAALGFITPDFVVPDRFLATDGATLDYAGVDSFTFASLPTDGASALNRAGGVVPNLAVNFAGKAVALPALPVTAWSITTPGSTTTSAAAWRPRSTHWTPAASPDGRARAWRSGFLRRRRAEVPG